MGFGPQGTRTLDAKFIQDQLVIRYRLGNRTALQLDWRRSFVCKLKEIHGISNHSH